MKCSSCGCLDSKVVDSRLNEDGTSIRRRRECMQCCKRFTTYENIENMPVYIIKKSGVRELFDINKLKTGVLKACEKRPVPIAKIEQLVLSIAKTVENRLEQEIPSVDIGNLVMEGLKEIDDVAYVRFASVHRQFKDIDTWVSELESIISSRTKKK